MLVRLASLVMVGVLLPQWASAQPASSPRVVAGKVISPTASLSARAANANTFRVLEDKEEIFTGDTLVSLPGGTLASKNAAVSVKSLADFDSRSSLPILETALVLHDPSDADLDFTLDRGRVEVTNIQTGADRASTIRLRFWDQNWKIVLDTPGSRVAVELCGRWPAGTRFKLLDPKADPARAPVPVASVVFVVLKGSASVDLGGVTFALKAPPGPAELRWNSLTGNRPQPQRLDKLPDWADPSIPLSEEGKKTAATVEKFRVARADDPARSLDNFLASRDLAEVRVALVALGALDDLDRLGKTLVAAKTLDEWDFGITVLRHWLGRSPGQEQRLYRVLTTVRGYTDPEAKILLQLLLGFTPQDLSVPETYEVLIEYLMHEKPGIRNLAAWHLVRLVPQGKAIPFKPDGTQADAEKAYTEWKKLVPRGKLPPPTAKK